MSNNNYYEVSISGTFKLREVGVLLRLSQNHTVAELPFMCKLIQPHTFKRSLVYIVSCMLSSLYTHTLCVMLKTR